jgi:hypothetical protein
MAALFQGAEDRHHYSLAVCALLRAISVTVLANNNCWANGSLGVVVLEGNCVSVEERKQIVLVAAKSFDQTLGVRVVPLKLNQFS